MKKIVAYGAGVNSSAMIVRMVAGLYPPDHVIFADTGGERPETLQTVEKMSDWLQSYGLDRVITVRADESLLDNCLRAKRLPSVAYGFKSCSEKYKSRPMKKWIRENLGKREKYELYLGFDAGEQRRVRDSDDERIVNVFPLVVDNIFRDDCVKICADEGLPIAKSSCFFCPSMKKREILDLLEAHPALLDKALEMERNAELSTVKGLGRSFSWQTFIDEQKAQGDLFAAARAGCFDTVFEHSSESLVESPCGCYDG